MRNVVKSKRNGRWNLPIPRSVTLSERFMLTRPVSMCSQQPTFRDHPDPDLSNLHTPCFNIHNVVWRLLHVTFPRPRILRWLLDFAVFGKSEHKRFGRNNCNHLLSQQFFFCLYSYCDVPCI